MLQLIKLYVYKPWPLWAIQICWMNMLYIVCSTYIINVSKVILVNRRKKFIEKLNISASSQTGCDAKSAMI